MWHRIVQRTGNRSVGEAKRSIGAGEFWRWVSWFEREIEEPSPEWQLLAQASWEIYLLRHVLQHLFSKKVPMPSKTFDDFLPKAARKGRKAKASTEITLEQRTERSKAVWFAAAGVAVDAEGKPIPGKVVTRQPPKQPTRK